MGFIEQLANFDLKVSCLDAFLRVVAEIERIFYHRTRTVLIAYFRRLASVKIIKDLYLHSSGKKE